MANLKVFLSSTCYDYEILRSELRNFIISMGHEPVMSEFSDMLFDPRTHTHDNCLKEVKNCDIVIFIIGSRFGGKAVPSSFQDIDMDKLKSISSGNNIFDKDMSISITQLEVLKAIDSGIPIFTFIDSKVNHDHLVYEKNKKKLNVINEMIFPSIDKPETARYIFEFINFIRLRSENNATTTFSRIDEIENYLKKQWSAFFQRLLSEQKQKKYTDSRMDLISSQIADIKTAIMTSITSAELKETARGAIKFRRLIDFIYEINNNFLRDGFESSLNWLDFLKEKLGIVEIKRDDRLDPNETFLLKEDGTFYKTRPPFRIIEKLSTDWEEFQNLKPNSKDAIVNAILDISGVNPIMRIVRYYDIQFETFLQNKLNENHENIELNITTDPAFRETVT